MISNLIIKDTILPCGTFLHEINQAGSEDVSWYVHKHKHKNVQVFKKGLSVSKNLNLFPLWFLKLSNETQLSIFSLLYYGIHPTYKALEETKPRGFSIDKQIFSLTVINTEIGIIKVSFSQTEFATVLSEKHCTIATRMYFISNTDITSEDFQSLLVHMKSIAEDSTVFKNNFLATLSYIDIP